MELETPRLLLREFRPDDQPAVHSFAADPLVTRYTAWGPLTAEETAAELRASAAVARDLPRVRYALAVTDRSTGAVLGSIELRVTSTRHRRGSLDFAFGRSAWGRGYATEAAVTDAADILVSSRLCSKEIRIGGVWPGQRIPDRLKAVLRFYGDGNAR
jgi:RimJ/RimL family protein N-acetyltransferase